MYYFDPDEYSYSAEDAARLPDHLQSIMEYAGLLLENFPVALQEARQAHVAFLRELEETPFQNPRQRQEPPLYGTERILQSTYDDVRDALRFFRFLEDMDPANPAVAAVVDAGLHTAAENALDALGDALAEVRREIASLG